ncbi:MAG: glutaredoxin family protein [Alphaproteobacteria bacterium]|nr:glutaredoxin family protein [Alphaproteobacteria bacterium]MCB9928235.1 glutaredoxin family protein [Alphaproteobacteria bacterium]
MSASAPPPAEREVVVYTSPMCAPCEALKHYLTSHGVAFRVRDLLMDEDAQDRLDAARIRSTPALEVDGQLYAGDALNPDAVKALLGL